MAFVVEIERRTIVIQGLPSPVRATRGLPLIPAGKGVTLVLKIGVAFDDCQLTERGWFFDTDATAEIVQECCDGLSGHVWTEQFEFRPTFELVARHLYGQLASRIPQLAFVELRDESFGVTTRYSLAAES